MSELKKIEDKINVLASKIISLGENIFYNVNHEKGSVPIYYLSESSSPMLKQIVIKLTIPCNDYIKNKKKEYLGGVELNNSILISLKEFSESEKTSDYISFFEKSILYAEKAYRSDEKINNKKSGLTSYFSQKPIDKFYKIAEENGVKFGSEEHKKIFIKNLGYTEKEYYSLINKSKIETVQSFDTPINEEDEIVVGDFIQDKKNANEINQIYDEEDKKYELKLIFDATEAFYLKQRINSRKNRSIVYSFKLLDFFINMNNEEFDKAVNDYTFTEYALNAIKFFRDYGKKPKQKDFGENAGAGEEVFSRYTKELEDELNRLKESEIK